MLRPPPAPAIVRDTSLPWRRRAGFIAATLASGVAVFLAAVALWWSAAGPAPRALPWLLAFALAAIAVALAAMLLSQRTLDSALHGARLEARGLADLLDTWQWRSDAQHRVTLMRPPSAAPGSAWLEAPNGQTLWTYFDADAASATALRAQVEAQAPLPGLAVWRLAADGERWQVELRGSVCSDAQGNFIGYLGSARVLNDEQARRGDQRLLGALLQALPAPVFELQGSADGPAAVRRGNAAAAQWLGLDAHQLTGLAWVDLQLRLPADLRAAVVHAVAAPEAVLERPVCAGWNVQARRIEMLDDERRAGDTPHAGWVLTLLPSARAEPAAAPEQAGSDHESFSYTVSHDLRAPIRVVEGFTKILKEDYGRQLDRIGNDHLDRVLGAAARMNSMIDALLALSQLSTRPLARQPVNLSQLAGYITDDLKRQSPERNVKVNIEAGLQTQGDPTLMRVALENLLGNAWKYTAKKREAQIWLERGVRNRVPVFTVRDNGAGFDMRFADRLFGVFQRLHSANDFQGTGVGLASVRRIISRHGGEIWAEAEIERGSSFHFSLPAGDDAHRASE